MALFSIDNVRVAGIAAVVPKNKEYNAAYNWIPKKEREKLIRTIGVETRHVAKKGITTSDLCVIAAEKLLGDLNWNRNEIELLVFVSQSRDFLVPSTACIVQDRLGLPHSCIAYDVGLGCSGYVYGLSMTGSMIQSGAVKKALLMVGDISTLTTTYRDKSTYPLFGDGGTVTALEYNHQASKMNFNLQTDGSGYEAIIIRDGGARNKISRKSFDVKQYGQGIHRNRLNLELDGIGIFNFSLREVVPNIKALLHFSELTLQEIDFLVLHQANHLINETLRKMLKLEQVKMPVSIKEYGNTSGASVPLTMVSRLRKNLSKGKVKLLLSAFGVGLSWGSVILETNDICCPEVMEV
jgi:3-oxoacyl-[acyl-carrier-protein] synthase-3